MVTESWKINSHVSEQHSYVISGNLRLLDLIADGKKEGRNLYLLFAILFMKLENIKVLL